MTAVSPNGKANGGPSPSTATTPGVDSEKGALEKGAVPDDVSTPSTTTQVAINDKSVDHTIDELPNGGYGWVIVVCLLGLNACTWGESQPHTAKTRT